MTPAEREAAQKLYNYAVVERWHKAHTKNVELSAHIKAGDREFFEKSRAALGLETQGDEDDM